MTDEFPTLEILGVRVARMSASAALQEIERLFERADPALVAYVNAHTLNLASRDPGYRAVLNRASIVMNDGSGVAIAARIGGSRFPENLNGSDMNPKILELAASKGWPVYFLGAGPGVADRAAEALVARIPGLNVVGTASGYLAPGTEAEAAQRVRATGAGLVMVAMGNPLQERWLDEHLAATGARLGVGVGAFFDFSAGEVSRAPAWMNRWGIEWLYRLAQEPGRMWRRYILGNPAFLFRVIKARLRGR